MRWFSITLFILFNIYLIESANRTESANSEGGFESENVQGGAQDKSDNLEDVIYEEYEYDDRNSISGKSEGLGNSTETDDGFPNEVFLSLRNITADAATAFRSFTNRNDVVDLQASASDNLNVTSNDTFVDTEAAGINLRALRDAGHPPQIIEESLEPVQLPYKHTKIDTADLSDCALQGEWKPIGVATGHLHVGGGDSHQDVLQSVGSYAVPNKIFPQWQQNVEGQDELAYNHKPSGLYSGGTGGSAYGSNYGYTETAGSSGLGQFQKIKSASMLSPPPVPPIIFGKKPGYWKLPKTKHKYFPGKGRRPGGVYGFSSHVNHGGIITTYGAGHSGGVPIPLSGASGLGHGVRGGGIMSLSGGSGHGYGLSGSSSLSYGSGSSISGGSGHGYGSGGSISGGSGHGFGTGASISGGSGHGYGSGGSISGGSGHGFGSGSSISGGSGHTYGGGGSISGGSVHVYGGGGSISGGSGYGFGTGASISGGPGHNYGGGGSGGSGHSYGGGASISGGSSHGFGGGVSVSGGSSHGYAGGLSLSGDTVHGYGGGDGGSLSVSAGSSGHSVGGAIASHLVGGPSNSAQSSGIALEELHSGGSVSSGFITHGGGAGVATGHVISGVGDQTALLIQNSATGGHLVTLNQGGSDSLIPEAAYLSEPPGGRYQDSTFSSTHISQGIGGNSLPDASFLSSQDFAVHGHGVSDDLSSSSTFTCGKNHDHNTNYHTATFQVADHDHPSSVDVLQYGGDAAVLIQAGDAPFHDHLLPERKHYKTAHLDSQVSGSDNELTSHTAKLTANPPEQDTRQTEEEPTKLDDGEEPERHSYYHEITKVTKIPATSVGTVEYTFSKYETKPQTFSTESETPGEEPEVEQPQIIRELEHLSNKFQLDLENPQKLFEDPPSQELAYHYPFQDGENNQEPKLEAVKEEGNEGITEFPYQFYHETPNNPPQYPIVYKKPVVKYIPRPGKPHFQKTYLQPKPPLVVLRKHKPKQFLKKQNYEVHEHGGERRRPIGEIFPPQKFPKQFHNPKPNFAVDRPKNGWRQDAYEYKYDHSKRVKKLKTKGKLVAPILIRRPVSPAPVIRVVEVTG